MGLATKLAYWRRLLILEIFKPLVRNKSTSRLARYLAGVCPNDALLVDRIGWEYCSHGSYAEAEKHLRRAAVLNPSNAATYHNLSAALAGQGKWSDALIASRTAADLDPNCSMYLVGLGQCQKEVGEFPSAIASLNEALRLDSENPDAFIQLSIVYCQLKSWKEALFAVGNIFAFAQRTSLVTPRKQQHYAKWVISKKRSLPVERY